MYLYRVLPFYLFPSTLDVKRQPILEKDENKYAVNSEL